MLNEMVLNLSCTPGTPTTFSTTKMKWRMAVQAPLGVKRLPVGAAAEERHAQFLADVQKELCLSHGRCLKQGIAKTVRYQGCIGTKPSLTP